MRRNILKIVDAFGGMDALEKKAIKVEVRGYHMLTIDYIGRGPNGHPAIAVAHRYEQNGDLMADPDMQMEIAPALRGLKIVPDELHPYTFQQDSLGLYQQVYDYGEDGKPKGVRVKLKKDLAAFMRLWDKNLAAQGFVKAAQKTQEGK